jgi:hypothetical protein
LVRRPDEWFDGLHKLNLAETAGLNVNLEILHQVKQIARLFERDPSGFKSFLKRDVVNLVSLLEYVVVGLCRIKLNFSVTPNFNK